MDDELSSWVGAALPGMTLRHFATMTSGYNARGAMYPPDHPIDGSQTPLAPRAVV